jgi:hypothetical protein
LEAEGPFWVLVPFSNDEQFFSIRAVAADGEQDRSIRPEFECSTPKAQVNRKEDAVLEWSEPRISPVSGRQMAAAHQLSSALHRQQC